MGTKNSSVSLRLWQSLALAVCRPGGIASPCYLSECVFLTGNNGAQVFPAPALGLAGPALGPWPSALLALGAAPRCSAMLAASEMSVSTSVVSRGGQCALMHFVHCYTSKKNKNENTCFGDPFPRKRREETLVSKSQGTVFRIM